MELHNAAGQVHFNTQLASLKSLLQENSYSKIFVLTDEHTSVLCLPVFQQMLDDFTGFDLIETSAGEENKSIDFCIGIWKTLLDFGADRKCLLINLGGGVITDMGGFIAATYKRGIEFINIPTSLLAQVDASVGGKTGIDIDGAKNMVGTFTQPQAVFIEHAFLATLPEREMRSGFAELLKHGLIADAAYFTELSNTSFKDVTADQISHSVKIKAGVVAQDPTEKGLRKVLNFGHTIGHAIESFSLLNDKKPLNHGEAIAIGMICESYLSVNNNGLSQEALTEIARTIALTYPAYTLQEQSFKTLLAYMQSDKKNEDGNIMFSLLSKIGACSFNCRVAEKEIIESLKYYNSL